MRTSRPVLLLATLAIVTACFAPVGIRADELECEQAVNKLAGCCLGFDPTKLECKYADRGCDPPTLPVFSVDTAKCIEQADCGALVGGVCARAQAPRINTQTQTKEVCP